MQEFDDPGKHEDATHIDIGSIQADPAIINYAEYVSSGKGLSSFARVTEDGRIVVSLDLKQKLPDLPKEYAKDVEEFAVDGSRWNEVPKINVVIMIVGSRGTSELFDYFSMA
jgi:sterol 3beta-glucosyltransferase